MKGHDPEGRLGPKNPLPDSVTIFEPPVEKFISEPTSEPKGQAPEPVIVPAQVEEQQYAYGGEEQGFSEEPTQPTF